MASILDDCCGWSSFLYSTQMTATKNEGLVVNLSTNFTGSLRLNRGVLVRCAVAEHERRKIVARGRIFELNEELFEAEQGELERFLLHDNSDDAALDAFGCLREVAQAETLFIQLKNGQTTGA